MRSCLHPDFSSGFCCAPIRELVIHAACSRAQASPLKPGRCIAFAKVADLHRVDPENPFGCLGFRGLSMGQVLTADPAKRLKPQLPESFGAATLVSHFEDHNSKCAKLITAAL